MPETKRPKPRKPKPPHADRFVSQPGDFVIIKRPDGKPTPDDEASDDGPPRP